MRLARGLTLALALLGPASTAQAAAVGLADQAVHHADRGQYGTAVRRFVALFPQVRTYTTWNEANHAGQPVADDPEAVAAYYDELRAACAGCVVVAGDVLDSGHPTAVVRVEVPRARRAAHGSRSSCAPPARASPHRRWTSPSPHPQPGGNA